MIDTSYRFLYSRLYEIYFSGDDEELNDDGETAAEAAASVARQARMAKAVELKAAKVITCICIAISTSHYSHVHEYRYI